MRKLFLASSTIGFMALFSLTACVEDSSNAEIVEQTKTDTPESTAIRSNEKTDDRGESLMNKPVDFSSPENVEKTLENIRQQEGDKAHIPPLPLSQWCNHKAGECDTQRRDPQHGSGQRVGEGPPREPVCDQQQCWRIDENKRHQCLCYS